MGNTPVKKKKYFSVRNIDRYESKGVLTLRHLEMCRIFALEYFWSGPTPPPSKCWLDPQTVRILQYGTKDQVKDILHTYMGEIHEIMKIISSQPLEPIVDEVLIKLVNLKQSEESRTDGKQGEQKRNCRC